MCTKKIVINIVFIGRIETLKFQFLSYLFLDFMDGTSSLLLSPSSPSMSIEDFRFSARCKSFLHHFFSPSRMLFLSCPFFPAPAPASSSSIKLPSVSLSFFYFFFIFPHFLWKGFAAIYYCCCEFRTSESHKFIVAAKGGEWI